MHFLLPARRELLPESAAIAELVSRLRQESWVMTERAFNILYAEDDDDEDEGPPRYKVTEAYVQRRRGEARSGVPVFGGAPRKPPTTESVPPAVTKEWIDARLARADGGPTREMEIAFAVDPDTSFDYAGLKYPFTFGGEGDVTGSYSSHDLLIQVADDFIRPWANLLHYSFDLTCACGALVSDEARGHIVRQWHRIHRRCPSCGAAVDLSAAKATLVDGWSKERRTTEIPACAYRFGICIDCEKAWPRSNEPLVLNPALRELVEDVMGERFEDFGTMS